MPGLSARALPSIVHVAAVYSLFAIAEKGCERERRIVRADAHATRTAAKVEFERGEWEVGGELLWALDAIAGRGSSDLSIRVLIIGFANE